MPLEALPELNRLMQPAFSVSYFTDERNHLWKLVGEEYTDLTEGFEKDTKVEDEGTF